MGICENCKKPFYGMGVLCVNCKEELSVNRKVEREEREKKGEWKNLSKEEQKKAMEEKRRDKSFWLGK